MWKQVRPSITKLFTKFNLLGPSDMALVNTVLCRSGTADDLDDLFGDGCLTDAVHI